MKLEWYKQLLSWNKWLPVILTLADIWKHIFSIQRKSSGQPYICLLHLQTIFMFLPGKLNSHELWCAIQSYNKKSWEKWKGIVPGRKGRSRPTGNICDSAVPKDPVSCPPPGVQHQNRSSSRRHWGWKWVLGKTCKKLCFFLRPGNCVGGMDPAICVEHILSNENIIRTIIIEISCCNLSL